MFTGVPTVTVEALGMRAALAPPIPVKLTEKLVRPDASVNRPVSVPVNVGVNVTLIVQLDPAARDEPQLFDCVKSPL
jgi:hypothetical protein